MLSLSIEAFKLPEALNVEEGGLIIIRRTRGEY